MICGSFAAACDKNCQHMFRHSICGNLLWLVALQSTAELCGALQLLRWPAAYCVVLEVLLSYLQSKCQLICLVFVCSFMWCYCYFRRGLGSKRWRYSCFQRKYISIDPCCVNLRLVCNDFKLENLDFFGPVSCF